MISSFHSGRSDYEVMRRWYSVSKKIWSKKEDDELIEHVSAMPKIGVEMNDQWLQVSKRIPKRGPKQCLERWFKHLRPKLEKWTDEDDAKLVELQSCYGNSWGFISSFL